MCLELSFSKIPVYLMVEQSLNGLAIDVRNQIARSEAGLKRRTVALHRLHQVVDGVVV